jgi:hypothetical protein
MEELVHSVPPGSALLNAPPVELTTEVDDTLMEPPASGSVAAGDPAAPADAALEPPAADMDGDKEPEDCNDFYCAVCQDMNGNFFCVAFGFSSFVGPSARARSRARFCCLPSHLAKACDALSRRRRLADL